MWKSSKLWLTLVLVAVIVGIVLTHKEDQIAVRRSGTDAQTHQVVADNEMRSAIESLDPHMQKAEGREVILGITSHHIPTAAPFIADLYRYLLSINSEPRTFIIIGPDHYERCPATVTIDSKGFATSFGTVEINKDIVKDLSSKFSLEPEHCLASEHAIATQAPFIARAFPRANIVGITFSSSATPRDVIAVANALESWKNNSIIIASTDFSHYQPVNQARALDAQTAKMIQALDVSSATLQNIDSPPTLQLIIELAKRWDLEPKILGQKNLYDLNGQADNTTGYINAVFEKKLK